MSMSTYFFISNQGQASVIKVAYIFIAFRDQNCLMVAQQFDQVTNICQEHSVFQDSKPIFITTDFKILPKIILKQLKFDALSALQLFYAYYKGKTPLFFNLQLLLLLNEKGLSPKSYLAICHPRASCLQNGCLYKKTKCSIVADKGSNPFDECAAQWVHLCPQEEECTSSS